MMAFMEDPNAQMAGVEPGISMREKLHSDEKYFGSMFEERNPELAKDEVLFRLGSSRAKT